MRKVLIFLLLLALSIFGQEKNDPKPYHLSLDSDKNLEFVNAKAVSVDYNNKKGIQVTTDGKPTETETLVIISDILFKNGIIELVLTGEPAPGMDPQMRGFVGFAFRVDPLNYSKYECIYLRPTNARAHNQLQRNHSTQYVSHPEYPWYRLREENPGLYESYTDIVPGEWTKMKIEVDGKTAKLYLHGADQPCLIVNDLKHEISEGRIALWLHWSTLARFRNLNVTLK
jgi:hypothetical protein